jgi:DNA-binding PadR family transcriptional regulator
MATIDLIVLGMLKKQALSAYDIQKLVEYRNISKWVRISTPSIYKKVIQLEEKGLLQSVAVRENNMPEKAVYSLTASGQRVFEELMEELSLQPVRMFLDFNAVIVNLDSVPLEMQKSCVANIEKNVQDMKAYLEENLREKENAPDVPETGMAVLRQQYILAETMLAWIEDLKKRF